MLKFEADAFENINLAMKLRESLYLNGAIEANEMIEKLAETIKKSRSFNSTSTILFRRRQK